MSEAPEYHAALAGLDASLRDGIKAFAKWVAENWQMSPKEWKTAFIEEVPSDDYFKGHNAAVQSVEGAAEVFLDDFHP